MSRPTASDASRTSRTAKLALVTVAVIAGIALVHDGMHTPKPPPQPTKAQGFPVPAAPPASPESSTPTVAQILALRPATPTRVLIPSIRVDAPLTALVLQSDGALSAPPDEDRNLAGWYENGASPGMIGTAVIDGHVDNYQGPAVFYDLGALKRGDAITIDRDDDLAATFTIDAVEAYDGSTFPSQKVYGWSDRAELRVITCGAGFDKRHQHYRGNVVVYAHLVGSHQA